MGNHIVSLSLDTIAKLDAQMSLRGFSEKKNPRVFLKELSGYFAQHGATTAKFVFPVKNGVCDYTISENLKLTILPLESCTFIKSSVGAEFSIMLDINLAKKLNAKENLSATFAEKFFVENEAALLDNQYSEILLSRIAKSNLAASTEHLANLSIHRSVTREKFDLEHPGFVLFGRPKPKSDASWSGEFLSANFAPIGATNAGEEQNTIWFDWGKIVAEDMYAVHQGAIIANSAIAEATKTSLITQVMAGANIPLKIEDADRTVSVSGAISDVVAQRYMKSLLSYGYTPWAIDDALKLVNSELSNREAQFLEVMSDAGHQARIEKMNGLILPHE